MSDAAVRRNGERLAPPPFGVALIRRERADSPLGLSFMDEAMARIAGCSVDRFQACAAGRTILTLAGDLLARADGRSDFDCRAAGDVVRAGCLCPCALHHAHTGNLDKRGPGEIYTMTVAEYATRNGVPVETLLKALNAEVEARQFAADRPLPFIDSGPEAR